MIGLSNAGVEMIRKNGDFNVPIMLSRNEDKGRVNHLINQPFSFTKNSHNLMLQNIKQVLKIRYQCQCTIRCF